MSRSLVHFKTGGTEDRNVVAIAGAPGRIYTPMVWIDVPMRLVKVPNGDAELFSTPIDRPTVRKAARIFLKIGKRLGITKGARDHLKAAV